MLPKSERVYVTIIVSVCLLIVIFSLIVGIRGLMGKTAVHPAYESAPPTKVLPAPQNSIVDLDNAQRGSIDDADYLFLHKTTRELLSVFLSTSGQQRAKILAITPEVYMKMREKLAPVANQIGNLKSSPTTDITVGRPQFGEDPRDPSKSAEQSSTRGIVVFQPTLGDISSSPATVSYTLYWVRKTPGAREWLLTGLEVKPLQAASTLAPDSDGIIRGG